MTAKPSAFSAFPNARLRRNRSEDWVRRLVSETKLSVDDLIWPIFLRDEDNPEREVASMPGVYRLSVSECVEAAGRAAELGIPALAIFPYVDPAKKTSDCAEATNPDTLVCQASRAIRRQVPNIGLIGDIALDPYNSDGHDGLLEGEKILNDETLRVLAAQAVVQADAGYQVLGPSDMMDGRVGVIREALDAAGHQDVKICSYAAKYASCFYAPFRDAVGSGGALKGDKKTYQMDFANSDEALREVALDLAEGADMIMVKPGLFYLDIIQRVKEAFGVPTFAYQVSGEYAMVMAAVEKGYLDKDRAMLESLTAFKRAGCDGILSYFAMDMAERLAKG